MISTENGYTYKIERRLNRGGFGSIFQALELNPSQKLSGIVAVKFVQVASANQQSLLEQELQIFKRLSGLKRFPRFISHTLKGKGTEDEPARHAIVHQLLGPSLFELSYGPRNCLAWIELFGKRRIIWKTLMCLKAIHAQNILHCDIKLQNFCTGLFKDSQTKVFLIDFGLAVDLNAETASSELSSRSWRGTLAFMSPRIQQGHKFTFIDDLISLFYALVLAFGTLPWAKESDHKAVLKLKEQFGFETLVVSLNDKRLSRMAGFLEVAIGQVGRTSEAIDYDQLITHVFGN
jgi:serine/threonine protein kinase